MVIAAMPIGLAQSGTTVNGIITSNTTWTQANSPYSLTGPVAVNIGVTLTIQAGTTVNLGSYYIQVNGTLVAMGNTANAIVFNSGTFNFEQSSNSWNGQTQTGCIIEYSVLSCTINIYNASPLISNNQFTYSEDAYGDSRGIYVNGGSPTISNNTSNGYIYDVSQNVAGLALISENTINVSAIYGEGGIGSSNNCDVIDNTLIGCINAVYVEGQATIEGNLLYQNNVGIYFGIYFSLGQAIIESNTIANNTVGIQLPSVSSTIIYNNLLNNQLSISLIDSGTNILQSNDINATYNYWGTTDQQAINQTIFDFKDNFNLGTVNFVPFLTAPNAQAPSLPTPTPTPSLSPSPSLTATPIGSSALSSSPSPTPTIPEFPTWIILPLFAVAILLSTVIIRKKEAHSTKRGDENETKNRAYTFCSDSNFRFTCCRC
jgi:hypothetical protein